MELDWTLRNHQSYCNWSWVSHEYHSNPSSSCWDIKLKTANFILKMMLEEKLGDHQIRLWPIIWPPRMSILIMPIHPVVIWIFQWISDYDQLLVLDERQGITRVLKIQLLGTLNVCKTFQGIPFNKHTSIWTTVIWQINRPAFSSIEPCC